MVDETKFMTLAECKDKYAREHLRWGSTPEQKLYYRDWQHMENDLYERKLDTWLYSRMHELAEMYADQYRKLLLAQA